MLSNILLDIAIKILPQSTRRGRIARVIWKYLRLVQNAIAHKLAAIIVGLAPLDTRRGLIARISYQFVKKPDIFIRNVSISNIKNFFFYFKTTEPEILSRLVKSRLGIEASLYVKQFPIIPNPNKITLNDVNELIFRPISDPKISIIIPVYNQWRYTYNCLKSILENTEENNYEIIIGNDCSSDETDRMLIKMKGITVVNNKENLGYINNCNNASRPAKGKYLLFLNNDTYVLKGWLSSLFTLAEKDQQIGVIGSKLIYPNGTLQEAGGIVWNDGSAWNYGRGDSPDKPQYNYVREVDYCSGACLLVRKDLFVKIGGFDSRYQPAYYDDSDMCFAVRSLGYTVMYDPFSVIVHYEGISNNKKTSSGVKKYQELNLPKFIEKWHPILSKSQYRKGKDLFLARDRSKNKRHILFVENNVPTWDRDAGSLTIYSYIKLFVDLGFHVTFIPDNGIALMPYTEDLLKRGVEVLYGEMSFSSWIKQNGQHIDTAWLARPEVSIKYIDRIKKFSKAIIHYYVHDLHYIREQRRYEIEGNPLILKESKRLRKLEFDIFEKVDFVLTPSKQEAAILSKEITGKRIEVISPYFYEDFPVDRSFHPFEDRKDIVFLGGFGHMPNVDGIKWFVTDIFPEVERQIPDVRLLIVGSNPPESIKDLNSNSIVVTGYVADLSEIFERARIFVSPLRYGAGIKGKIITSMCYGVPVVTTTIGNEGIDLRNDQEAIVEDNPNAFSRKTIELYTNKVIWDKISKASIYRVKRDYSRKVAQERIMSIVGVWSKET
jgi:O-antigen biosynthesis protein